MVPEEAPQSQIKILILKYVLERGLNYAPIDAPKVAFYPLHSEQIEQR